MLYKNRTMMKTRTFVVLYMILFLSGLAITSYSQGITNSGGYINGSSSNYINFGGSSDLILISTTADRTTFGIMVVDFTGTGTYTLTIPDSSYITLDSNLVLNDTLILEASSSGMASLVMSNNNATVTGAYAKVEQHIPAQDEWHMVSSPVSNDSTDVYTGLYLLDWSEPDSSWTYIFATDDHLSVTKGYFAWSASGSSAQDVTFEGILNTGNQTVANLTYNDDPAEGHGWCLIGNPYPSTLEWTSAWTKSNIDATIYCYDGTQYKTWNYNAGGTGSMGNGNIPSTQGFWVKANAASPSITIPNSARKHSSQSFYKGSEIPDMLNITITGNTYTDEMSVGVLSEATEEFDSEYDAYKLFGIEDAPQLYSYNNDIKYAVNLFPEIEGSKSIPIGLKTGIATDYTLTVAGLDNFNSSIEVYLEDKASGEMINLRETTSYEFYSENGLDESRFVLHFNPEFVGANSPEIHDLVSIYSFDKTIFINYQMDTKGDVSVYDLMGKEIISENLVPGELNKFDINNEKGYYIVKVISEKTFQTSKVFID